MSGHATAGRSDRHGSPQRSPWLAAAAKEMEHKGYADALVKLLNVFGENFKSEDHQHAFKILQDISGVKDCSLLECHIILSELFTSAVSSPRVQKNREVLYFVLDPLSKIWTQSEWETNLTDSFCHREFRKSVSNIVVFFEKELKLHLTKESSEVDKKGSISYSTLTTLLPLILAPLLKLLQYVHALWTISLDFDLPEELEGAKYTAFSEELEESVELLDIDEEEWQEDEIREWLEQTRRSGYNVIGMCAQLDGGLSGFLDSSAVCGALMKDLNSMEFRHLSLIIEYTIIPLVKCCPAELWTEWIDGLLCPLFTYFHDVLYRSWRRLLHKNTVQIPDIDYISASKEKAEKFGMDLLIKLTRAASDLLAVVASPELNGGVKDLHAICTTTSSRLELIRSKSLVGYVLYHDGLHLLTLSLVSYIFGEWKDREAMITSVPFCHRIIQLATATQSDIIVSFLQDDIIPHVIKCLTLESSSDRDTLSNLCEKAYDCFQNQDLWGEGKYCGSTEESFESWLRKQMQVVRYRNTPFHELEEFIWIWEIEEEFMNYFPAYIDMLHQVDEMDDWLECDYSSPWDLLEKWKPEFVSKYATNSEPGYIWTMSNILSRKIFSKYWQRQHELMCKFFCELIDVKPCIEHSSYDKSMVELVKNSEVYPHLDDLISYSAVEASCAILSLWEPQFHPLIRKGHKDMLIEIFHHLTYLGNIDFQQPLQPDLTDFPEHLSSYAGNYINTKNKRYHKAKEQAKLHEEFDTYLASGAFDHYIKGDAVKAVLDDSVPSQFSDLDHALINLSIERRSELMGRRDQLCSYSKYLKHVADNEQLRNGLQSLMYELEHEGFFSIADESIDWDNTFFSELVEKFGNEVFAGLHLPKHYVVRGIMDYRAMSLMTDSSCSWDHAFAVVVGEPCRRWMQNLPLFWMETRYYEHDYYDIIRQPLQKIWTRIGRVDSTGAEWMGVQDIN